MHKGKFRRKKIIATEQLERLIGGMSFIAKERGPEFKSSTCTEKA